MGGWPKNPDAKKAIRTLKKEFGWTYDPNHPGKSSHATGTLFCGEGCQVPVYATARDTAKKLWSIALRCPHGKKPTRRQW